MAKLLLLAIAIWLLLSVVRRYRNSVDSGNNGQTPTPAESMVKCAKCGLHLPKNESVSVNQQFYCCEAHSTNETDARNY